VANLKALLPIVAIVAAVFALNMLTGGGLFAMFSSSWRAPAQGEMGSQALCQSNCDCPLAESCVDRTCRVWGCTVSSIGGGGCAKGAVCKDMGGYGVCVRKEGSDKCAND
jgi:hypothetical protein